MVLNSHTFRSVHRITFLYQQLFDLCRFIKKNFKQVLNTSFWNPNSLFFHTRISRLYIYLHLGTKIKKQTNTRPRSFEFINARSSVACTTTTKIVVTSKVLASCNYGLTKRPTRQNAPNIWSLWRPHLNRNRTMPCHSLEIRNTWRSCYLCGWWFRQGFCRNARAAIIYSGA